MENKETVHTPGGKHLIIEFRGCSFSLLNDPNLVETHLRRASQASQCTILHSYTHAFKPNGVTCFAALAESHISIHCWPLDGYAAIDIFMCGDKDPTVALKYLMEIFDPLETNIQKLNRR